MNKNLSIKQYIHVALFASMLAVLSGCDWFKSKSDCATCVPGGDSNSADKSVVLATIGGTSVTVGEFDEFLDEISAMQPQLAMMLQYSPDAKPGLFKEYLNQKVILHWAKQEKKDQDIEYKKKYKCACRNVEQQLMAQVFEKYILDKVGQTDAAAEEFYKNRDSIKEFQHPTFLKKAGGVKVQAVQFTDEKSASAFLDKAKKPGANFANLAKDAKKTVNTFGNEAINMQTKNVDGSIKMKLAEIKDIPSVELIRGDKGNFWVVKAISKTPSEFKPFNEVKETVKQVMMYVKGTNLMNEELQRFRTEYKVDDSKATAYFEEQRKKKEQEFQEQIKAAQAKAESAKTAEPAKAA